MQLALSTGRLIFVGIGRRTAASWKTKQLEAAMAAGFATIATAENIAKLTPELQDLAKQLAACPDPILVFDDTAAPAATTAAPAATTKAPKAPKAPKAAAATTPAPAATTAAPAATAPAATTKAPKAPKAAKATAAVAAAVPAETTTTTNPAEGVVVTVAEDTAAATKPTKPAKAPKAPKVVSNTVGIRYTPTRSFLCGQEILAIGADKGLPETLIAKVDADYGEANPRETMFAARNAWHAIRGYMGWADVETLCSCHGIEPVMVGDAEKAVATYPEPVGVRYAAEGAGTRPYVAGMMIRKHGIQVGLAPAMIAEIDKTYSDESNIPESTGNARRAWHAIRGYLGITTEELAVAKDAELAAL